MSFNCRRYLWSNRLNTNFENNLKFPFCQPWNCHVCHSLNGSFFALLTLRTNNLAYFDGSAAIQMRLLWNCWSWIWFFGFIGYQRIGWPHFALYTSHFRTTSASDPFSVRNFIRITLLTSTSLHYHTSSTRTTFSHSLYQYNSKLTKNTSIDTTALWPTFRPLY